MKLFALESVALTVASLYLPLVAQAQKFQEPTREELQMTSDPKAPGAPAVFLDLENTVDNESLVTSEHARIKILTDAGKQWATVEFPYDPRFHGEPAIEGRVIHSDGTVVRLSGKPSELISFRDRRDPGEYHDPKKIAVFTLPGAETGSIVEYSWSLRLVSGAMSKTAKQRETSGLHSGSTSFSVPRWLVQRDLFLHKAHFSYLPFINRVQLNGAPRFNMTKYGEPAKYFLYAARLPAGAKVEESPSHEYTLDVADVPPIPREADAPAVRGLAYAVQFYYSPYFTAADLWPNQIRQWSAALRDDIGNSQAIAQAASRIVASASTPEEKAHKLYDAVESLENTEFTRASASLDVGDLDAKTPEEAWRDRSGSSNDLAKLYLALARSAGLDVEGLLAVDRSRGAFDPNWLSLDQFVHLLVVLKIDGKDIYLDPGEKLCPFGQLHWSHMLTAAVEENAKESIYTPQNLAKDAITGHVADLTVDASGAVSGTVKILMNGPAALYWRQLNLTTDPGEVQKLFDQSVHELLPRGISREAEKLQGIDTAEGYLSATVKVSGQLGLLAGKRLILPAFFFSAGARPQFASAPTRETAVDLHYAEQVIDDVTYHLPTGYEVESSPQPAQLAWPGRAALVTKTQPGPDTIDIKHIFARAFVVVDPKAYPALRGYYQKLATTDEQQVVLAPSTASGN